MGLLSLLSCFSNPEPGENRLLMTTTFNIMEELCHHFSLAEIQSSLASVNESLVIGEDSFGAVYKGYLKKGDTTVAIKWFKKGSLSGLSESQLKNENSIRLVLSQLHRPNLVPLIGFRNEGNKLVLDYEYMTAGSLHDYIYH
ncbi:hypothetical protein ACSQ67_023179 [Phaseolus vulgaris]